jgi:hypothetical protein
MEPCESTALVADDGEAFVGGRCLEAGSDRVELRVAGPRSSRRQVFAGKIEHDRQPARQQRPDVRCVYSTRAVLA